MIYRCRRCQYEEARGCLPTVTSGLYMLFLLGLSTGGMAVGLVGLRMLVGEPPNNDAPVPFPWWANVLGVVVGLVLAGVGVVVVKYGLELLEYLMFAWRRCPQCGLRRWSWGFTRGFGM